MAEQNYTAYKNSSANGTIRTGAGVVWGYSIQNGGTASTVTWSDGSTLVISQYVAANQSVTLMPTDMGVRFNTNITVSVASAVAVITFYSIVS